jgi:GMP synthase (glutamine-hydrolysing)
MATILVIEQVPHERLGTFAPVFKAAGAAIRTLKAYEAKAAWPAAVEACDALVVMGGPQSASELSTSPYLKREITLLQQALKAQKPILGVCLGAQLLATALGARVSKNEQKEIGWYPLMREPGAEGDPLMTVFGQTETVFQWHGDTFTLPKGAVQLASAPLCAQQAFRYGPNVYGLQFHVEVTEAMIRAWLQVNQAELASLKGVIDPSTIRQQVPQHLPRLKQLSDHVAQAFMRLIIKGKPHAQARPAAAAKR